MKNMMTLALFLILNITLVAQTTYYVSASSGNDSNDGRSEGNAWRTLARVNSSWESFGAGDSILFNRGDEWAPVTDTYLFRFPNGYGGTENAHIVLGAYGSGNKPILSQKNSSASGAIRGRGLEWFIFQDIEIRGAILVYGNSTGTHHLKFLRLTIDGNVDDYNGNARIFLQGTVQPTQTVNVFEQLTPVYEIEVGYCDIRNSAPGTDDAINFNVTVGNIWIHHNTIINTTNNEAIDIGGGNNITIEYNKIHGARHNFSGLKIHSQYNTIDNLIFRGNEIVTQSSVIGLTIYGARNSWIYNNTISHNTPASHAGMYIGSHSGGHALIPCSDFENTVVANNIVNGRIELVHATGFTTNWSLSDDGFNTDIVWTKTYDETPLYDRNYFYNNVFYNENVTGRIVRVLREYGNGSATITDEEYGLDEFADWLAHPNVHNDIIGDPQFINGTFTTPFDPGNYKVQSTSPALESGYIIEGYQYDVNGNYIPPGTTPDRGAHQITNSGGGGDITPPQLTSATVLNTNSIQLTFSEGLNEASAENTNNYSISGGVSISNATYQASANRVVLSTSTHSAGNYTVTVNNIADIAGNNITSTGNTRTYTISGSPAPTSLTVFLEGSYTNNSMRSELNSASSIPLSQPYDTAPWNYGGSESVGSIPQNVVDWVFVELRNTQTSLYTHKVGFVLNTGRIVATNGQSDLTFGGIPNGNYYIVVHHRNHLSVMSSIAVESTDGSLGYDFSTSASQTFGDNSSKDLGNGVYGLISGDTDGNGLVNNLDFGQVAPNIFQTGYHIGDLDMNNSINVLDYGKINNNLFSTSKVPVTTDKKLVNNQKENN